MIKKEIFLGFFIGIGTNILGMLLYILLFSEVDPFQTVSVALETGFLGTVIAAGAIFNFLPFFMFLNKKKIYRARGVLMASIFAALFIAVIKFT